MQNLLGSLDNGRQRIAQLQAKHKHGRKKRKQLHRKMQRRRPILETRPRNISKRAEAAGATETASVAHPYLHASSLAQASQGFPLAHLLVSVSLPALSLYSSHQRKQRRREGGATKNTWSLGQNPGNAIQHPSPGARRQRGRCDATLHLAAPEQNIKNNMYKPKSKFKSLLRVDTLETDCIYSIQKQDLNGKGQCLYN